MQNSISRPAVFIVFAGADGVLVKYKVVHGATGQGSAGDKMALCLMLPGNTVRTGSGWNGTSALHSNYLETQLSPVRRSG